MEELDKKNRNRHEETIITLVKQKDTSLAELRQKTSRQAVLYHIPKLCKENLIRVYVKGSGVKDEDIFYIFVNRYEAPQEVSKLIKEMQSDDISFALQRQDEFIRLCMERGSKDELDKMLAYYKSRSIKSDRQNFGVEPAKIESVRSLSIQLMSKRLAGYENHVAFLLTSPPSHIQHRLQFLNQFA